MIPDFISAYLCIKYIWLFGEHNLKLFLNFSRFLEVAWALSIKLMSIVQYLRGSFCICRYFSLYFLGDAIPPTGGYVFFVRFKQHVTLFLLFHSTRYPHLRYEVFCTGATYSTIEIHRSNADIIGVCCRLPQPGPISFLIILFLTMTFFLVAHHGVVWVLVSDPRTRRGILLFHKAQVGFLFNLQPVSFFVFFFFLLRRCNAQTTWLRS